MRKVIFLAILIIVIGVTMTQFSSLVESVSVAGGSDAEFKAVAAILNQIESGQNALALMEKYAVEVKFVTGGGTYYLALENKIVINRNQSTQRAALSFIHEMTHARYYNEGLRVDIGGADQELYVQGRIEEEAEGVVNSIEAKKELAAAGFDVSQMIYPLEEAYTEAHQRAQNAARVRKQDITSTELESIGQDAGTAQVIQGFVNGEVQGSKRSSPYTETYGECWSAADALAGLFTIIGKVISAEAAAELAQSTNDFISSIC